MANIQPFRGLRYNPNKICDLSDVITAPYDRIHDLERARYYDQSPYSLVRIIQGLRTPKDDTGNNVYTRAQCYVRNWLAEDVFIREPEPALYVLEQRFTTPDGVEHVRRGLTGALELTRFDEGVVLPHEHTLRGPKVDRLNLTVATETSWGHIFILYPDEDAAVNKQLQPYLDRHMPAIVRDRVIEPEVEQNFWVIRDEDLINSVVKEMQSKQPLIIADGHHRYETALGYRDDMRDQHPDAPPTAGFNYVLATFVSMNDPGLVVLPTHRLIHDYHGMTSQELLSHLQSTFDVESAADFQHVRSKMSEASIDRPRYGFYDGSYAVLTLKDLDVMDKLLPHRDANFRHLDVTVLHELVIERVMGLSKESVRRRENITYLRDPTEGLAAVDQGEANFLFLLNPTRMAQIRACTAAGERMPQKSTDFFPKIVSGLVALPLEEPLEGSH